MLTLTGTGLGADLVVLVEGQPAVVLPGATNTEVRVVAPESVLATAGAFRVVVGDPGWCQGDGFVVMSPGRRPASVLAEERAATAAGAEAGVARPSVDPPAANSPPARRSAGAGADPAVSRSTSDPFVIEGPTKI